VTQNLPGISHLSHRAPLSLQNLTLQTVVTVLTAQSRRIYQMWSIPPCRSTGRSHEVLYKGMGMPGWGDVSGAYAGLAREGVPNTTPTDALSLTRQQQLTEVAGLVASLGR